VLQGNFVILVVSGGHFNDIRGYLLLLLLFHFEVSTFFWSFCRYGWYLIHFRDFVGILEIVRIFYHLEILKIFWLFLEFLGDIFVIFNI